MVLTSSALAIAAVVLNAATTFAYPADPVEGRSIRNADPTSASRQVALASPSGASSSAQSSSASLIQTKASAAVPLSTGAAPSTSFTLGLVTRTLTASSTPTLCPNSSPSSSSSSSSLRPHSASSSAHPVHRRALSIPATTSVLPSPSPISSSLAHSIPPGVPTQGPSHPAIFPGPKVIGTLTSQGTDGKPTALVIIEAPQPPCTTAPHTVHTPTLPRPSTAAHQLQQTASSKASSASASKLASVQAHNTTAAPASGTTEVAAPRPSPLEVPKSAQKDGKSTQNGGTPAATPSLAPRSGRVFRRFHEVN